MQHHQYIFKIFLGKGSPPQEVYTILQLSINHLLYDRHCSKSQTNTCRGTHPDQQFRHWTFAMLFYYHVLQLLSLQGNMYLLLCYRTMLARVCVSSPSWKIRHLLSQLQTSLSTGLVLWSTVQKLQNTPLKPSFLISLPKNLPLNL